MLGKEHPDTLTNMNNLAGLLSHLGKYEQAEETRGRVLGLRETVLGKEHPGTLVSMSSLAGALRGSGRVRTAFEGWAKVKYIGGIFIE